MEHGFQSLLHRAFAGEARGLAMEAAREWAQTVKQGSIGRGAAAGVGIRGESIDINFPREVRTDAAGFNWLAQVAERLTAVRSSESTLKSRSLTWYDGNLCAPLGALLHSTRVRANAIALDVPGPILGNWSRNGFAYQFGGGDMVDTFDTALVYTPFTHSEEKRFAAYVLRELMPKDIPQMTEAARRQFERNLQEIFNNAASHARSPNIFSCGQFFPAKNYINFTVTDLGVGFRANVERKTRRQYTAIEAIQWASQDGHTSRMGRIPGGLGLGLLRDFVARNGGRLQIVSENGVWELTAAGEQTTTLEHRFPGSFVNLQIKTDDALLHKAYDDF